jgi:catechol 2,3-dioxygenase-like lactoylglutathione lyase family enzyme
VLHDLPGVGENFHNHVLLPVVCISPKPIPRPNQNMSEAALFYRSAPGWPAPDMQMAFVHADPTQVSSANPPDAMVMLPGLVRPLARGYVRLASPDPMAKPLIHANYLGCEADFRRLTDAVRLSRRIYGTRAMSEWVQAEVVPGPGVADADLGDYVREAADSYHHQAGACRMGQDSMAVVDPQLRVHGIQGLRVADASVMPAVPSGNCHAAIVMIGEKVADMVKSARRDAATAGTAAPATGPAPQPGPAVRHTTFHHVALTCRDPIRMERWYTKHFGFRRSRLVPLGEGNQIVFLRGAGIRLELFRATADRPVDPPTGDGNPWPSVRNISFEVADIDAHVRAMGADAEVAFGPLDFSAWIPGWRSVWLRDPEGYLVQVTQGYVDEESPPPLPPEG